MKIDHLILLAAVSAQERPRPDTPEDRARRAAIVDRIMAEPEVPRAVMERERAARLAAMGAENDKSQARARREISVSDGHSRRILTIELPGPENAAQDVEIEEPGPIIPIRRDFDLKEAVLERENFDRWIFGEGRDEEGRRVKLQILLSETIDRSMKVHRINTTQLQKLRLAGSGDIKRFLDRVEERRPEFEVARKSFKTGYQMLRELGPLSAEFQQGPFGDDSFFAKTLKKIEDDSRAAPEDGR